MSLERSPRSRATIADSGLPFAKSVHGATRKMLLKIRGFSEMKVEKIKEAITKLLVRTSGFTHALKINPFPPF